MKEINTTDTKQLLRTTVVATNGIEEKDYTYIFYKCTLLTFIAQPPIYKVYNSEMLRTRNTNVQSHHHSNTLRICEQQFLYLILIMAAQTRFFYVN